RAGVGEAVPMPGDGLDAQAAILAGLVREQMAQRPPVSERFKAFLARRDINRTPQDMREQQG
ncbi:hypothetical protein, partial [Pseudomonas aeruginosa]|uniref:hypothetical protein n=1 Tax=Pseudomonas aeruginosa TaxID=287 RepID=UPI00197EA51A